MWNELWNSWDLKKTWQGDTMAIDELMRNGIHSVIGQSGEHK